MAIVNHQKIRLPPANHDPSSRPVQRHDNTKYTAAVEAERSRDLYLQGAMAVGQIARLLEELCADMYNDGNTPEEGLSSYPSDVNSVHHQFLSYEKREQINVWACAVSVADDNQHGLQQRDEDIIDLEDPNITYLRGAFVVGDIADLLDNIVRGFGDDDEEDCLDASLPCSPEQITLTRFCACNPTPRCKLEIPDANFEVRMSSLSARLDKLEVEINAFSRERCDALMKMVRDDSAPAQVTDLSECSQNNSIMAERVDRYGSPCYADVDALGVSEDVGFEDGNDSVPITRVWTTTDTATSGFSIITPAESEIEAQYFVKDYYLWNLD